MSVIPSIPEDHGRVQSGLRHLQRCLSALDKIQSIDPDSPAGTLARVALENKPQRLGGTSNE
jgi:hypothetical protein